MQGLFLRFWLGWFPLRRGDLPLGCAGFSHLAEAFGKGHKIWSGRQDLNLRLYAPKAYALPDCATPRHFKRPAGFTRGQPS